MKKTMFKRIFAGIAAMFMMCLFLPIGFTGTNFKPSLETVAKSDGWQDMYGIEYKIEDDTLIINNYKRFGSTSFDGHYFQSYAADIKHLEIGSGWGIGQVRLYLSSIQSLKVGDNCTIGAIAFYGCATLTSVKIGDNCTIDRTAFRDCTALESVEIGNDCTIGERAFWYCTALKNVTIGDSCTIEFWAFDECDKIEKVTFYGGLIENVNVDSCNPAIICNKSCWTICKHQFDAKRICTVCGYECKHIKSCDINHKCTVCGYELDKQHILNSEFNCTICGYFDEAAIKAEIEANEAEIKQKENEITQKQERNAYLNSLLNQQENTSASTFSNGSVLVIIGCSTFLILCGLAAVIIVKKRKKTE